MLARRLSSPRPFIFKRWSRSPWAVLSSLHRHVVIGVVNVSIANAQMLKSGRKFVLALIPTPMRRISHDDDDDAPPGLTPLDILFPTFTIRISDTPTHVVTLRRAHAPIFPS